MPVRPAHEISMTPAPRCPVCGTGITASGRNQPVAVDASDRPHCRAHGHLVAPEYDGLLTEYERIRVARAALLRDAAESGIRPTAADIADVRSEWRRQG